MVEVTLTKGLPGSGKSTWAKAKVDKYPGRYKRVNKDDLRAMLDNSKHSKENEQFVEKMRDLLIMEAIAKGKHVIVDDTNFSSRHETHIRQMTKGLATVVIKDFTDVSVEECIKRDLKRTNSVGEKVIRTMYDQFVKPKVEQVEYIDGLPTAIMCDLDGTLALMNGRNPYDASTCADDLLNKPVADVLKNSNAIVLLVSAREDKYRPQTIEFLNKHNIKYESLFMRQTGDNRKDSIVKTELFNNEIRCKYNIHFVLDDRTQVVDTWRSLGLTCFQVAPGDF